MRLTLVLAVAALLAGNALAADRFETPRALAVRAALPPPPAGTSELEFREIFVMPVGPRGLELSGRVRALDGKRVRLVGYMIASDAKDATSFLLSPLPIAIDHDDESLADEVPPSIVRISGLNAPIPPLDG